MSNISDYLLHTTVDPLYYQRRVEHDLPPVNPGNDWKDIAKRVALISVPFISLYKPAGQGISIAMGSCRCFTNLAETLVAGYQKDGIGCAEKLALTALSVVALAGTLFNFKIGLLITTTVDMGMNLIHMAQHLSKREFDKAFEELLQTASSALYLGIMLTGSLEVLLSSVLLQGLTCLYQSRSEWKQGKWPEFIAKLTMGIVRFYQAHQYVDLIKKRNAFLTFEKFSKLMQQVNKGRDVAHLVLSPLQENEQGEALIDSDEESQNFGMILSPVKKDDKEVMLVDSEGKAYSFGINKHGYGKEIVKGMNLQFRTHVIDGKKMKELDFKVNHVFRNSLETLIQGLNDFSPDEMKEFLDLTHSHAKGLKLEKVPYALSNETGKSVGTAYKITLEGLGSVLVGDSAKYPNLYDRVRVEMESDKSIYECHELLSFFNLEDAIKSSSKEDFERLKIGQLFRVYHPKEASIFEREDKFFTLSIKQLKEEIIQKAPSMKDRFKNMLPKMEATEILPGRVRYSIPGLSDKAYDLGGRALVSTITGTHSAQEGYDRLASVIKMGMLSSEMRYSNGMTISGLSPSSDFFTGGADSVYTQLLTEKNFEEQMSLNSNLYWGNIRVMFSLDLINAGTYQYHTDSYGLRQLGTPHGSYTPNELHYLERPNILDFVKEEQQHGFHHGNEVMIKERIDPSMITGVIVPDKQTQTDMLNRLRDLGVVDLGKGKKETILGIPVESFIHIGKTLSKDWLV